MPRNVERDSNGNPKGDTYLIGATSCYVIPRKAPPYVLDGHCALPGLRVTFTPPSELSTVNSQSDLLLVYNSCAYHGPKHQTALPS
jgi:hypothetical protein